MNPTLRRGDVGASVRHLQLLLVRHSLAARLKANGRFGARTEHEVQAFQRRRGLADDGVVGPLTWAALGVRRPLRASPRHDSGQPRDWMAIARAELDVREVPGINHHPRILAYHATTGAAPKTDEAPWCSSFVNWVMREAGYRGTDSAGARSWIRWGTELTEPRANAVMVTLRDGDDVENGSVSGYHVGFLVRSDGDSFVMLGGNQGSAVSEKSRKYANYKEWWFRWPA
jgi:uncharacterized protein (TIGR02594 family)